MDRPDMTFRLNALPAAVFVDLLRDAGEPLDSRGLKARLEALGIDRSIVDAAWKRGQPGVKRHGNVGFDPAGGRYRWIGADSSEAGNGPDSGGAKNGPAPDTGGTGPDTVDAGGAEAGPSARRVRRFPMP